MHVLHACIRTHMQRHAPTVHAYHAYHACISCIHTYIAYTNPSTCCARSMPHVQHRAQVRNRRPDLLAAARARRCATCWQGAARTRTRAHAGAPVRTYAACHDRGCLLGRHKRKPQASERAARTRALVDRSFIRRRYLSVPAVQPCTPTGPCHCALQAANGTGCNRRCCAS